MNTYDIVILTDRRYVAPETTNPYIDNVLLEDRLVAKALEKEGMTVTRKSWDDPNFDWASTRYVLFRSTWDYFDRYPEFSKWLDKVSKKTQLINSEYLIRWNIDKHYMMDLQQKGVRIPKTLIVEPSISTTLEQVVDRVYKDCGFAGDDLIVKPCISGGARHTYKINKTQLKAYETVFQELVANEAMMVQEFQQHIVSEGELSVMVFDGKYSHAILKVAKEGDFRVQDDYGGSVYDYSPGQKEIAFAEAAVRACPELPVYARVDMFRDNKGQWALAELELIEPELWFRNHNIAATHLAKAIKKKFL